MAKIIMNGDTPICSGCGEEFKFTHYMLNLSIRTPYGIHNRPSSAEEVFNWGKLHRSCPDPIVETLSLGMVCTDRRVRRE